MLHEPDEKAFAPGDHVAYTVGSGHSPASQVLGQDADAQTTANFYMYCYKVVLCQKRYSHDWGACPFAHGKEKARRRDPLTFNYTSCICSNAPKRECPNGVDCPYAHTLFEYWLHPARFRTQLCRSGSNCKRALCFFAHNAAELRRPTEPGPCCDSPKPAMPAPAPVTSLLGALPQCALCSESTLNSMPPASAAGSGKDPSAWPLTVEERSSSSSFNSQCSVMTSAGKSLSMLPTPAAATIISCPGPDAPFGQLPSSHAICSSSSSSSSSSAVPPTSSMLGPITAVPAQPQATVSSPSYLLKLQMPQAQLLQMQLELQHQQENVRAALLEMEQKNGMSGIGPAVAELTAAALAGCPVPALTCSTTSTPTSAASYIAAAGCSLHPIEGVVDVTGHDPWQQHGSGYEWLCTWAMCSRD